MELVSCERLAVIDLTRLNRRATSTTARRKQSFYMIMPRPKGTDRLRGGSAFAAGLYRLRKQRCTPATLN